MNPLCDPNATFRTSLNEIVRKQQTYRIAAKTFHFTYLDNLDRKEQ